jgi:predicted DNA-binding transcriptional regulator AlpA
MIKNVNDSQRTYGSDKKYELCNTLSQLGNSLPSTQNPAHQLTQKFVDRKQLSQILRISTVTIWKRMSDGTLPFFKIGRRVLFDVEKVMKKLQSNNVEF